jgi:GLPGLI family protein
MKTLIMFLIVLITPVAGNCQNATGKSPSSGKVTYEDRVKKEIRLDDDEARFSESPQERVSNKVLLFNPDFSLYQQDESKKSEGIMQISHTGVRKMVFAANDKIFTDLKNKKKIEQKDFMTRLFLIESDLGSSTWKLTGRIRKVLGYNCQEAIMENKDKKIRACFTSSIPVAVGPECYGDLPGLILLVDINDGKQIITATSIDLGSTDYSAIPRLTEGTKVTMDEYKMIVDEKMKEMESEGMGNGGAAIIRNEN